EEGVDLSALLLGIDVGERAVRRAEVDPDDVAGSARRAGALVRLAGRVVLLAALGAQSSTSAGATTEGSAPDARASGFSVLARQPWCLSVPLKGGEPTTFPTRRTARASKPLSTVTRDSSSPGRTASSFTCSASAFLQPAWMPRTAAPTWASSKPSI